MTTVFVLEGPGGVVDVFASREEAEVVRDEMLARDKWARVTEKEVR